MGIIIAGVVFGILAWGAFGSTVVGALAGGALACLCLAARLR